MDASPGGQQLRSPAGARPPKWRRQQRHIYLEVMGATPLKSVLITMIVTAIGCMVMSVMQSKNLSEIVGDNEVCIAQLNGKQLCIQQFEALNCTPPNATVGVPPSTFDGNMNGISPYNGYFTIDTRFISPNTNTTAAARSGVFPKLTYNITVLGREGGTQSIRDVVYRASRQMYGRVCIFSPQKPLTRFPQILAALLLRRQPLPTRNCIHHQLSPQLHRVLCSSRVRGELVHLRQQHAGQLRSP